MQYELYRRCSLGLSLTDALDEMIQSQKLNGVMAMRVLHQFDKSISEILSDKIKVKSSLKGHLNLYRYLDDVWTFIVDHFVIKIDDEVHSTNRIKIVGCKKE